MFDSLIDKIDLVWNIFCWFPIVMDWILDSEDNSEKGWKK